jgi:ribonucleoside-diphosphate reductase alpha chain
MAEGKAAVTQIKKRDGRIVEFDKSKITNAIFKAAVAVGGEDREIAEKLTDQVIAIVNENFAGKVPTVEDVQDTVEKVLIEEGHAKTAKVYILYRQKRAILRELKAELLNVPVDEVDNKLSVNAIKVLERRYLKKDKNGQIMETPKQMFRRVARAIAMIDAFYDRNVDTSEVEEEFYSAMVNLEFLPNSPTLMNAGTGIGQLSACFVLPVEDSIESIFNAVKNTALIHQSGGGTGYSFSHLRPKGDVVKSTGGIASGPVSFMRVFDVSTDVIKQGGKRRGANMGMLRVDHPDILEFITAKSSEHAFNNFNISVAITDKFMDALGKDTDYDLINPRNGKPVDKLSAKKVFKLIVQQAWKNGEPGMIFIDKINAANPTPSIGMIESTNPCIAGDSLVPTENGMERMEELASRRNADVCVDNRMLAMNVVTTDGGRVVEGTGTSFSRTNRIWMSGVKNAVKLVTKSGFELVATPDHKIMTTDGWVEISRLVPKRSRVLVQSGAGSFSKNKQLKVELDENIYKRINVPRDWSVGLGRVLGWLIGDGWLCESHPRVGFTFGQDDGEVLETLKPELSRLYGKEIREVKRENGVIHLSYHSKPLLQFFKSFGIASPTNAETKEVPKLMYTAPEEAVVGFLQGLFTSDGTVNFIEDKSSYIRLTSKSRKLLSGVQLLLLNLGIKSRIYDRSRKCGGKFEYETVGGEHRTYECDGVLYELEVSKDQVLLFLSKVGFIGGKNTKKIEKLKSKGYYSEKFYDEVAEVLPLGMIPVYDLTEPKTHSFIANGIVISNCGEQPLLPYESCNLGSVNLSRMVGDDGEVDWERFRKVVWTSVHFLDNVIDANKYPTPEIERMSKGNRKIGLGVMGFADMLFQMGVAYNSEKSVEIAEKVMKFIDEESKKASAALAERRGAFPNFEKSIYNKPGAPKMRNATTTTIAPTGTLSIIAGCSSGIEPLFAIAYVRRVMDNTELLEVHPVFEKIARKENFYSLELIRKIARSGGVKGIEEVPEKWKDVFVVAYGVSPEWHVRIQAAFQKYVDNAVSKTINFPVDATQEDVEKVYLLAYKLGCKGVTVYRDKSREGQVLSLGAFKKNGKVELVEEGAVAHPNGAEENGVVSAEYVGGCTTCQA